MKFNYKTVTRKILADLYTPVGVYMRLRDIYPQSALMESSDYHGSENSRSFIGVHPLASIAVSHGEVIKTYPDGRVEKELLPAFGAGQGEECKLAISKSINDFISSFHVEGESKEFCGLYGFTTFNAVRYFENIPVKDTTMEKNDAPDIYYIMYKDIIVFDHFNNTMELIALQESENPHSSLPELDELLKAVNKANVKPYDFHPVGDTTSTLTDEEHKANIRRCIQHCLRGDVFQIVVSRASYRNMRAMISNSTVRCAASTLRLTSSISTSAVSASSVLRLKPITASWATRRSLTRLPEPPDAQEIWSRTARLPNSCATTRRRMPSTLCW